MSLLDPSRKPAPQAEIRQFVVFRIGKEAFGLDIAAIAEVVRPLRITPLPRMPEFIEGVINLRGTIIPVVDLRTRFAAGIAPGSERTSRMIITKGALKERMPRGRGLLALVVDAVDEVVTLSPDRIDRTPEAATGAQAEFLAGVGKLDDRLIILVDLSRILSREERTALAEVRDAGA